MIGEKEKLRHEHKKQRKGAIPKDKQAPSGSDAYNAFVFFNMEAAFDEGHALLGLGPIGGNIETFSFYRKGNQVKAPGLMACLEHPETFEDIIEAKGWIQHGNPGNYWNEHMQAALAMEITEESYRAILKYALEKKAHPGEYELVTYNCLGFVEGALAAGGVHIETKRGRDLHTFVPKKAFDEAAKVSGAKRFGEWKYWFPIAPPPDNGLRTIPDKIERN